MAIKPPANAGPRMRDRLNCVAFNARAEGNSLGSTMVGAIVWNEGMESASVTPTTADSATTIHG